MNLENYLAEKKYYDYCPIRGYVRKWYDHKFYYADDIYQVINSTYALSIDNIEYILSITNKYNWWDSLEQLKLIFFELLLSYSEEKRVDVYDDLYEDFYLKYRDKIIDVILPYSYFSKEYYFGIIWVLRSLMIWFFHDEW